jgi:hypothetical protein
MDLLATYKHHSQLQIINSATINVHNLQITASNTAVSSTAVRSQRLVTVDIFQVPALTSLPSGEYPTT